MHYVQIISFATTDEFVTTDRLKRPALEFLNRMKGCLGVWYGCAVDGGNRAVIICSWKRREAKREMESHKHYPKFFASLPTPMLDTVRNEIIAFEEFPEAALNAPVTTITKYSLKETTPEKNINAAFQQIKTLNLALDAMPSRPDPPFPILCSLIGDGSEGCTAMAAWQSLDHYRIYHETGTKTLVETYEAMTMAEHLSTLVKVDSLHVALVQTCLADL